MAIQKKSVEQIEQVEQVEQVEQIEQVEPDNDALIEVRNDRDVQVLGIPAGGTGQVTYGAFKSALGLVEI